MAQKLIYALAAIALIVLWLGLRKVITAPDPTRPPTPQGILATIQSEHGACDRVDTFRYLGKNDEGWDFYLARCHDGGRYLYMQSATLRKVAARNCVDQAAAGYRRCPD